jgi:capsular polysaccharide biosynthesis protein
VSLLLILAKIWRYKLVTLPLIALILAGAFYVVAVTAPTYEASAMYILVNPPPPPTDAQIARNPALGKIKGDDNPYTRFSDQSVLVQVLAGRVNSDENRRRLVQQGADPNYLAQPSADFGFSAPILQITGTGITGVAAVKTTNLVGEAMTHELDRMQEVRGVNKDYRITTEAVVPAVDAKLKPSGKLRSLVAVLVLGTVLLFIAISILDALNALRSDWRNQLRAAPVEQAVTEDAPVPLKPARSSHWDSRSFSEPDPSPRPWPIKAQR